MTEMTQTDALGPEYFAEMFEGERANGHDVPERFEEQIEMFEQEEVQAPSPGNAVVFYGSSTIREWHPWLQKDMQPLTVVPRGFGGSNFNDACHYARRVLVPLRPRAVVVYEGDNDIGIGIPPGKVTEGFERFLKLFRTLLPETRLYFVSIKPSPSRIKLWPAMQEVNQAIAGICERDGISEYLDISEAMLQGKDVPPKEIFQDDMLHMQRSGYDIWREALQPRLLKREYPFEPPSA